MPTHHPVSIAAVRGAISVPTNDAAEIRKATVTLLTTLIGRNALAAEDVVSAVFTATPDLDAAFPAQAARDLGWHDVPLLGAVEMAVPGAPPRLVRVLLTVARARAARRLAPVYLGEATRLRPDLAAAPGAGQAARAMDVFDPGARPRPVREDHAPPPRPGRRVALVGLGQIGGSIGLALGADAGWLRTGFDIDGAVRVEAEARAAVDATRATLAEAVHDADLAIVAVPVDRLAAVVAEVARHLPRGAALIDTGSARGPVTPALHAAARLGLCVVGGHPLAGSEGHGLAAARADLFAGSGFVLCPISGAPPAVVLDLVAALGARALIVDERTHDAALARTSHLPYLLACALRDLGGAAAERGLAGPAYRGMTRIAAARPGVARAYCAGNAENVRSAWREFRAEVDRLLGDLTRAHVTECPARVLDPFDMA